MSEIRKAGLIFLLNALGNIAKEAARRLDSQKTTSRSVEKYRTCVGLAFSFLGKIFDDCGLQAWRRVLAEEDLSCLSEILAQRCGDIPPPDWDEKPTTPEKNHAPA